tara:strand:+ start:17865 stop:17972 length:108 start_codon:yes stop_codon:yes gene_type:complete
MLLPVKQQHVKEMKAENQKEKSGDRGSVPQPGKRQ